MSKRSASTQAAGASAAKRTTATLNSFFPSTSVPSLPSPIVSSSPLTDRQSTFIAHACPITHPSQAVLLQSHVRNSRASSHPLECDHEILAWRTMTLKVGKDGLGGEQDWTVKTGGDDDGEKSGAREIHAAITNQAAVDVAVVVSRLYGGVMLGPVRFHHINQVATQALQRLAHAQTIPPLIARLTSLDQEISQFAPASSSTTTTMTGHANGGKAGSDGSRSAYDGMEIDKLERLCLAREKRLELLKRKFREEEEALWKQVENDEQGYDEDADPTAAVAAASDEHTPQLENGLERPERGGVTTESGENEQEEEIDEEEEALWAALEAQATTTGASSTLARGPTAAELGLPDEEDAAIAAATLAVDRKKREREQDTKARTQMGGESLLDE